MARSKLSVPRGRAIVIAGITTVVLAPLANPLVPALAFQGLERSGLSYRTQPGVAVLDPVTGWLIHPITGVVINLADVVYDVTIGQYVDPTTGAIVPADGSIPGLPAFSPTASSGALDDLAPLVDSGLLPPAAGDSEASPREPETSAEPNAPVAPSNGVEFSTSPDSSPPPLESENDVVQPRSFISSPASTIVSVVDLVLDGSSLSEPDKTAEAG